METASLGIHVHVHRGMVLAHSAPSMTTTPTCTCIIQVPVVLYNVHVYPIINHKILCFFFGGPNCFMHVHRVCMRCMYLHSKCAFSSLRDFPWSAGACTLHGCLCHRSLCCNRILLVSAVLFDVAKITPCFWISCMFYQFAHAFGHVQSFIVISVEWVSVCVPLLKYFVYHVIEAVNCTLCM